MKLLLFFILNLFITQASLARDEYVRVSSIGDFGSIDSIDVDELIYFSDLRFANLLKDTELNFLRNDLLNYKEGSLEVLLARAQFKIKYTKENLNPRAINSEKNVKYIYNSKIIGKMDENTYMMKKTKLTFGINYKLKTFSAKPETVNDVNIQKIIDESRLLDSSSGVYLGSVIHKQSEFSRMFESGTLVANMYQIDDSVVAVSAYSIAYIRTTAVNVLDQILFWKSSQDYLKSEVEKSLKSIFKAGRTF